MGETGSAGEVPGSRLSRRTLLATAATSALVLGGCRADGEEPRPGARSSTPADPGRFPGDPGPGRLYLGASLGSLEPAAARPDLGGAAMSMTRRFYRADQVPLMAEAARGDVSAGILPFVSSKLPGSWAAVARGEYDAWLDDVLGTLADVDAPVLLALHHEPENDVGPDHSRQDWVALQQRALARAEGTPVTVVPVLMTWTFRHHLSQRDPQGWLVPGAPLLGVDLYNPWQPTRPSPWVEFAGLLQPIRAVVPDLPLVVPEVATAPDPADPMRTALWLRRAVQTAVQQDVVGMAWFDTETPNHHDRRLDEAGRQELQQLLTGPEIARLGET
ncbi:MAG TPA: hypothetical protein PLP61_06475 [Nocardioides sp.]|uniref:hypothetical protein n=1 Tax=Nocardioides sp. TaxID=35761 RepID=UPI002BA00B89|nr:hypothetical protein [Nocardioides sp.]HQR26670.1 hypothetical protein [Nocardioides sp.]